MKAAVIALLIFLFHCCPALADTARKELEIWTDISFDTTSIGGLDAAEVHGRKLVIGALRYSRPLIAHQSWTMDYTLDVIPVAIAFSSEVNAYGWGASPIGFSFKLAQSNKVHPFFDISGGFLHFDQAFPSPAGTQWNFTATAGGGIRFQISKHFLDAGYMFHHISNGREQVQNPSLNTHVIFIGFVVLMR
ncbi:MAG: hypothetical protein C5B54_12380 [Acidobacteria bacterium]|nr:MAG: hypothetical protein C5B54_12380 [Acidobacteriota bacterium]